MERQEVFRVLQIEETKDKNVIKNAYRSLLSHTNPEDDPEGFKRLRQAYEEAMFCADSPDEDEAPAERDTSPIGLWWSGSMRSMLLSDDAYRRRNGRNC